MSTYVQRLSVLTKWEAHSSSVHCLLHTEAGSLWTGSEEGDPLDPSKHIGVIRVWNIQV